MTDAKGERERFEAAMRERFECSEHSFERAWAMGYYNSVSARTFGGRRQSEYAAVSMLWETWQAALAPAQAQPVSTDTRNIRATEFNTQAQRVEPTNCFYCAYRLPWHAMTCTRPRTESAASAAHAFDCPMNAGPVGAPCDCKPAASAEDAPIMAAWAADAADRETLAPTDPITRRERIAYRAGLTAANEGLSLNLRAARFDAEVLREQATALQARVEALDKSNQRFEKRNRTDLETMFKLEERVEAAELDAKRYRWLRAANAGPHQTSDQLDAMCDAAIGADKGEGK
jgi:hypothetical protein